MNLQKSAPRVTLIRIYDKSNKNLCIQWMDNIISSLDMSGETVSRIYGSQILEITFEKSMKAWVLTIVINTRRGVLDLQARHITKSGTRKDTLSKSIL